jgi:predicted  nucleic acid-binding Zn-ribbon protein
MATETKADIKEITVEEKLDALYQLQSVNSEIDRIKTLRGELPLEVQDLEDEIAGLQTRIENFKKEISELDADVVGKKSEIEISRGLVEKYKEQQNNVRNNREYDNLSKEIEFQSLEVELCEKRIREYSVASKNKKEEVEKLSAYLKERNIDLTQKKDELSEIVSETKQEEEKLREQAKKIEELIEPRLLLAFKRIRKNARNGLAVVYVQRDACGGCFNKIPPQRQMDIRLRKKIIVCEYCGRILVDPELAGIVLPSIEE